MWRSGLCFILGTVAAFAAANSIPQYSQPLVPSPALASPYQPYQIKLISFVIPPGSPTGLLIKGRIDGGPELRLLLDSGAEHIVLDRKAAARSGYTRGTVLDLVGAGGKAKPALQTMAGKVEFGDVVLRNCPLVIVDGKLLGGIDGVAPLSLFAGFLVHLDIPGHVLRLEPFPAVPQESEGFVRAHAQGQLLFVETRLDDAHTGYLLLDTGASYNAISNSAAGALKRPLSMAEQVPIQAGPGATDGRMFTSGVSYRFGDRKMSLTPVVAVDLSEMSRRHQMDISGVIGYPALARAVVSVNYRESLIRIKSK